MPLLVVGSVALDSVETPDQKRDDVLGGSAVYFSYAASYFTPVRLMGVVEPQREILRKICPQFREMEPHGVDNYCCGGGGGRV